MFPLPFFDFCGKKQPPHTRRIHHEHCAKKLLGLAFALALCLAVGGTALAQTPEFADVLAALPEQEMLAYEPMLPWQRTPPPSVILQPMLSGDHPHYRDGGERGE